MPPCCMVMAGAGHDVMPPWLDQLLIVEEDDQDELLDALLSLAKEIEDPLEAAS